MEQVLMTNSEIPGTDVSAYGYSGLVPEVTTPGETGNITINTTGTGFHDHEEIFARLDAIEAKLDHLLEHAHQEYTLIPKKNEGT
tara:strand:+ start:1006 stop:1260 length:255 start_codon:yes stop_codon:yes gene_type:complete